MLRSLDKGASDLNSGGSCSFSGLLLINTQHNSGHVVVDWTVIQPIGRECRDGQIFYRSRRHLSSVEQRTFSCEEVNFI